MARNILTAGPRFGQQTGALDLTGYANPQALPLAESGAGSVLPDLVAVGNLQRACRSGDTYTDPDTGVLVVRVTDEDTLYPMEEGTGFQHGYTQSHMSQTWESGGEVYFTLYIDTGDWLVDVRYSDLQLSNWRRLPQTPFGGVGEIGVAWSKNRFTPRILYYSNFNFDISGSDGSPGRIERFNTETMQYENTGNFPWQPVRPADIFGGTFGRFEWFQVGIDDRWMAAQWGGASSTGLHYLRVSDGYEGLYRSPGASDFNEFKLDLTLPYIYLYTAAEGVLVLRLEDGVSFQASDPGRIIASSHHGAICGGIVGLAYNFGLDVDQGAQAYRPDLDQVVHFITTREGLHSAQNEYYFTGGWCLKRRSDVWEEQWIICDKSKNDDFWAVPLPKIRNGMLAYVQLTGEVRLFCCHGSQGALYNSVVQASMQNEGIAVCWTSDMNASGRHDVFLARCPVS